MRTPVTTVLVTGATLAGLAGVLALNPSTGATTVADTTAAAQTYTGDAYDSPWGSMQVAATVVDGQITDIEWLAVPMEDGHSARINSYAAPLLVEQALTAQSADVDGISGATYTTEGFRMSLESAIAEAGL